MSPKQFGTCPAGQSELAVECRKAVVGNLVSPVVLYQSGVHCPRLPQFAPISLAEFLILSLRKGGLWLQFAKNYRFFHGAAKTVTSLLNLDRLQISVLMPNH